MSADWVEAISKRKQGTEAFGADNYVECATCLEKAIEIVEGLPADSDFDKPVFLAGCRAELAGAYGKLNRHEEAIRAADAALQTFRPIGYPSLLSLYPNEANYYFAAAFNRAQSLYNLGKLHDAQTGFVEAQRLFYPDGPPDLKKHLTEHDRQVMAWRKLCYEQVETIESEKRTAKKSDKGTSELREQPSNCFVVTVIYGDAEAPQVTMFRHYRDNYLRKRLFGRLFIRIYYSGSGRHLSKVIARNFFSAIPFFRKALDSFIYKRYPSLKK